MQVQEEEEEKEKEEGEGKGGEGKNKRAHNRGEKVLSFRWIAKCQAPLTLNSSCQ